MDRRTALKGTVDLHLHTTASDGLYSPREVVALAKEQGLAVISVTDHDTIKGIREAAQAAAEMGLTFIPGVEISAEADEVEVHILGYCLDEQDGSLERALTRFREARLGRAQEMLDRLRRLGMPLEWERVLTLANGGTVGRPHIARALVEEGFVTSVPEAFEKYLAQGQPAFVPRIKATPAQIIRLIREAGGVPVLAHPWGLQGLVSSLVEEGLEGLEAYYTGYTPEMTAALCALAEEFGLICTGGSDFHGSEVAPANVLGGVYVPHRCVTTLKQRHRELTAKRRA